ncbi:MAG: GNAT family N-acetyltransferase [Sphaerochaetaceae bacterium]
MLQTKRLSFRPFKEEDAPDVFAYAHDPRTVKYLTWPAHKDVDESKRSIRDILSADGCFAIVNKDNERVIGCFDLRIGKGKRASFGYVLKRDYWNQGFMTETLSFFLGYIFSTTGIDEVESCHEHENQASGKVMSKCGMHWTHLEKDELVLGKKSDNDHYLITREEFQKRK